MLRSNIASNLGTAKKVQDWNEEYDRSKKAARRSSSFSSLAIRNARQEARCYTGSTVGKTVKQSVIPVVRHGK